jgi:hypothetical protein|tara:strand:- start:97 stop:318 length:222 start_codon:yes stop_codon:yes gene_type:complete
MEDNIHIARIATALEKIANLMENQEKRDIVQKKTNIKGLKEAVKTRKNELLQHAANRKNSNAGGSKKSLPKTS